ncbi:Aspartate aminotransferase, cytoplasmic [Puccinia graminis f. sp. tritici]|uniref:Aspartate aminotransferase, cytoplasmic n=1 Tax=Puccinia graminis f. sp. tritici TaxID=56615 RepID=A0A5B0NML4_PUCGR|nr:Aspartate aminotransferase, cytoplasmic [Puccinia graminis f. sp. tritici]KAA1090043.1 Aspartate aminotransferase, cytoplasmic [Puccinia graminis f. sp. tritici]
MPSTQNIFASLALHFKLTAAYKADQFQEKVNLGVGAYRVDCGKQWVGPTGSQDGQYLLQIKLKTWSTAFRLYLGPRVAKAQTISGTGANHLGALFLAYQGLTSGDWAVRHLVDCKNLLLICQCFAKNVGPYGDRIGCLTVVPKDQDEASRFESQISILQHGEISNPPAYGAWVVSKVLNKPQHFEQWKENV